MIDFGYGRNINEEIEYFINNFFDRDILVNYEIDLKGRLVIFATNFYPLPPTPQPIKDSYIISFDKIRKANETFMLKHLVNNGIKNFRDRS